MTAQSEHLMELANEIVRLRTENEKLKRKMEFMVPHDVVMGIKQHLWNALEDSRLAKEQIDSLNREVREMASIIDSIRSLTR